MGAVYKEDFENLSYFAKMMVVAELKIANQEFPDFVQKFMDDYHKSLVRISGFLSDEDVEILDKMGF